MKGEGKGFLVMPITGGIGSMIDDSLGFYGMPLLLLNLSFLDIGYLTFRGSSDRTWSQLSQNTYS